MMLCYNIYINWTGQPMDLDFILFTPPKIKYSFIDLWGEVVFIPKMRKKVRQESGLASFLNCYKASNASDIHLTIDAALLQAKGTLDLESELMTEQTSREDEEQIDKHIPCLFLDSMVGSRYLIIYFHASGEDIKLSHNLLDLLRNLYQVNVLAMEYSGYSIYKGKTASEIIKEDSQTVYAYAQKLGFKQENIIVMGRSIGTGVALELMQKANPGALVLISPFASIKSLARQFVGFLGSFLAKQTYDNKTNILSVSCPTFFIHGQKDDVISFQNSLELAKLCYNKHQVLTPRTMTHANFDFYSDLADPLRQFLMHHEFRFYEPNQKGPQLPDLLFECPQGFKV